MAARDPALARAICAAVRDVDPGLVLYGLAGSAWIEQGHAAGLRVAQEVFADRSYQQPGAMITDPAQAVAQVLEMVREGSVTSVSGKTVRLQADTLCIHGDQPGAADFARAIRQALQTAGIAVRAAA